MYFGIGMQSHHRTSGPTEYVAMSLDQPDLARAVGDMAGRDVAVVGGQVLRPPDHSLARLQSVLQSAIEVARTTPEVLSSEPAAKSLEQVLLGQMIECLQLGDTRDDGVPRSQHVVLAKRIEEAIEANLGNPLSIVELSRMVGVPERRLRKLSQEQWGISPTRFLLLRRLHLARYALLRADPDSATVTKVALDMGFWELGRFAVTYKSLFGESPSATLRRRFEVERAEASSRIGLGPNLHSVRDELARMTAITKST
jgi:AraC-like DNA-binding protein